MVELNDAKSDHGKRIINRVRKLGSGEGLQVSHIEDD